MINDAIKKAYKILFNSEGSLSKELALELANLEGEDILDLVSLANKVKKKYSPGVHICTIMNSKSGECYNDCKFCAQSSHHSSDIETYPLVSVEHIVNAASKAYENGVNNFGIVTSGNGYKAVSDEFKSILNAIDKIHEKYEDMNVCASLGILTDETAKALSEKNIKHYNINIQVTPEKYEDLISTTHSVDERIETIKLLKKYGIRTCTGGIIGVGETMADRIDMAYALKELDIDVIPLNVLIPVEGTALENKKQEKVSDIVKTFALFRLINKNKTIKFAAGRETVMKDYQALIMLSGADSFLTGGYLTTRGRSSSEDLDLLKSIEEFK